MVRRGISFEARVAFVDSKINTVAYLSMFLNVLDPFIEEFHPKGAT